MSPTYKPLLSRAIAAIIFLAPTFDAATAQEQEQDRPNILVIWGDDIGWTNVSAYGSTVMG